VKNVVPVTIIADNAKKMGNVKSILIPKIVMIASTTPHVLVAARANRAVKEIALTVNVPPTRYATAAERILVYVTAILMENVAAYIVIT